MEYQITKATKAISITVKISIKYVNAPAINITCGILGKNALSSY